MDDGVAATKPGTNRAFWVDMRDQGLQQAIDAAGGIASLARKLGIGRSTLYRKLKDLGIEAGEAEEALEDSRVA